MAKKQHAALLARVSTPHQIKLGLESQVAVLKRKAIEDGYEVPEELIFQEQISGLDAKKPIRKSLQALMDAVEEHRVDVIYTYEWTRISRDPYNLIERVKWFNDHNIPMYVHADMRWTLDRKTKEVIEKTTDYLFNVATYGKNEAEKMKERTKRGRDEVAKEGLYVGHLSDGYCVVQTERGKEIKIDDDRKEVIKKIFDLYTQGYSIDKIAEYLNTNNVPSANSYRLNSPKFKGYKETYHKKGSDVTINRVDVKWQGSTISNYLRNEWYIGKRTYNGEPYKIDAIIKADTWNIVSTMLKQNAISFRSKKESSKHPYLLSGLFYCGKCGKRMYGHYTGLNNHYYCSSVEEGIKCGLRGVSKENIEAAVTMVLKVKGGIDIIRGKDGAIGKFFKISPKEEKKLKEEIKNCEKAIIECNKEIERQNNRYTEAVKQSVDYASDEDRIAILNRIIKEAKEAKEKQEEKKEKQIDKINLNKKKLNGSDKADRIYNRLINEHNLPMLRELFTTVIEKVIVYNLTPSIDVIKINFIDDSNEYFLYSYRLMKQNIRIITNSYICYDEINNVLKDKYKNEIVDATLFVKTDDVPFGYEESDYLDIPFERLEELSDKAKEQDAKYKELRKKYNTGLPTTVPYVVKDETYKEIIQKKKHLYNRKYKIKKHKKLTDEEKNNMLMEIDNELALLTAKIKYLSRTEALKEYEKQKKSKK